MTSGPQDQHLEAAAFLVETRKRDEANRRAATQSEAHAGGSVDPESQLRAAAVLVASRAQREAVERATRVARAPRLPEQTGSAG